MSQVSKRRVHKTVELKMFETLWEVISLLKDKEEIKNFTADILAPSEKIMIAKRLAIAALLLRGYSYESIKELLKVSQATIAKVAIALNSNIGYKTAINKVARSQAAKEFWEDIQKLAHRIGITRDTFKSDDYLNYKFGFHKKTLV